MPTLGEERLSELYRKKERLEQDIEYALDDLTVLSEYVARMRYDLDKLHEQIDECVRNLLY